MGITVEFKDFNEMVTFAQVLLKGYQTGPSKVTETVQKEEAKRPEPSESETSMNNDPVDEVPFEEESTKTYTLEEVRAALAKLTRSGKQKQVKELLTSFGAKNLSGVDSKDYAALMEKAGAL